MSNISPISRPNPAALGQPNRPAATPASAPAPQTDSVEVSTAARLLAKLAEIDVRQGLVDRVRSEIAAGTYDTPEKVDAMLDELIDDLV